MKRTEGVHASYIGRDFDGAVCGDRVFILSDEGSMRFCRWLTGAKVGMYDELRPRDLVADASIHQPADEFAFEAGRAPTRVAVNVAGVYEAGGTVALFEALEEQGHFDNLKTAARQAVLSVREAIAGDEEWAMIREALGQSADEVEDLAIIAAIESGVEGDD